MEKIIDNGHVTSSCIMTGLSNYDTVTFMLVA